MLRAAFPLGLLLLLAAAQELLQPLTLRPYQHLARIAFILGKAQVWLETSRAKPISRVTTITVRPSAPMPALG